MTMLRTRDALTPGEGVSALHPALCIICGANPRLGSLKRCKACLQKSADADRQARVAAEAKVWAREQADQTTKQCATCGRTNPIDLFQGHPKRGANRTAVTDWSSRSPVNLRINQKDRKRVCVARKKAR
jgi:hypothetical protein